MATTTNYGWTTPDDTALVKDGAAAIRTLGSSVDTTTKNLNPETTLGDLAYRSSTANVKTRLGLGSAGQVLQVNSGATAPEWATPSSGGMDLISTTTLSGSTTTLTSIPGTYKDLRIIVRNMDSNNDPAYLGIRMNADANSSRHKNITSFGTTTNSSFDDTIWEVMYPVDDVSVDNFALIDIYDYTNTTTFKMGSILSVGNNQTTVTNINVKTSLGIYNQLSAITSLEFRAVIGSFTAGTVLLYGVK
jgi:hypothetical protein